MFVIYYLRNGLKGYYQTFSFDRFRSNLEHYNQDKTVNIVFAGLFENFVKKYRRRINCANGE